MSDEPLRVGLVGGGSTKSLAAARDIEEALTGQGFAVTRLDRTNELVPGLANLAVGRVLIAAGGPGLGDGRLQGACELLRLPYTHSGVTATALAADRHLCKLLFKSVGLPVTDHVLVHRAEAGRDHVLPPPYIVKSRLSGAGAAAIKVRHKEEAPPRALLEADWAGSEEVLVERFLPGSTLSAFIMGNVMLGIAATTDGDIKTPPETLIPAPISPKIYEECTKLALKAHGVLGCRGVTVLKLRFNPHQGVAEAVVLGLGTQPDLSRSSPLSQIAARAGHEYGELLRWIVEDASCAR